MNRQADDKDIADSAAAVSKSTIVYIAAVGEIYESSCWEEVFFLKSVAYREAWAERNRRINNDRGNGTFGRKFECPGYWAVVHQKTVRG